MQYWWLVCEGIQSQAKGKSDVKNSAAMGLVLHEPGIPGTDFIFLSYFCNKSTHVPKFQMITNDQASNTFLYFHYRAIH